jgi:hypothetical protein
MSRSRVQRQRRSCPLCLAVGVEISFLDELALQLHLAYHKEGLVMFTCLKCSCSVVNRERDVEIHAQDACFPEIEEEHLALRSNRIRLREDEANQQTCFLCGSDFNNRSRAAFLTHVEECQKSRRGLVEERQEEERDIDDGAYDNQHVEEEEEVERVDKHWTGEKEDELSFGDFGSPPCWKTKRMFGSCERIDPHLGFKCDAILLNTIRASGIIDISDNTFRLIFEILNSDIFRQNYCRNDGSLSKTYDIVKKREKDAFSGLFKQVLHNGSVCFVRDLKDIVEEMFSDKAFIDCRLNPDKSENGYNEDEKRFESDWTYFPNAQERIRECRRKGAELQPLGLWLDEGEMDDAGNPIYLIVLFPLNCPKSFSRQPDVCYPVAYTYSASKITDCIRYLLPQFEALKTIGRMFPGQAKPVFISIEGLAGDFPAKAKLLMRTQVAVAGSPCNDCLIKNDGNLSDTSGWNAIARTQVVQQYF